MFGAGPKNSYNVGVYNMKSRIVVAATPPIVSIIVAIFILFFPLLSYATDVALRGKIIRIIDGDTVELMANNNQKHIIRLYGVDAPEDNQPFGNKATEFISEMVLDERVWVFRKYRDRYGRWVGVLYVDSTCVNQELVGAGLAWVYGQYCRDAICKDWKDSERRARDYELGLWSGSNSISPWEYRAKN